MTLRRAATLAVAVIALAGCDKVYFARIDVGPPAASRVTVSRLIPAERERAVSVFRATASQLGLRCAPSKYSIITDSYDRSLYQFSWCRAEGQFTLVQLAEATDHVTVEVHQIGGIGEPQLFKKCRTRLAEALQEAFPKGRVTVRYPYHWSPDAQGGGKEVRNGPSNNAYLDSPLQERTRPAQATEPRRRTQCWTDLRRRRGY